MHDLEPVFVAGLALRVGKQELSAAAHVFELRLVAQREAGAVLDLRHDVGWFHRKQLGEFPLDAPFQIDNLQVLFNHETKLLILIVCLISRLISERDV